MLALGGVRGHARTQDAHECDTHVYRHALGMLGGICVTVCAKHGHMYHRIAASTWRKAAQSPRSAAACPEGWWWRRRGNLPLPTRVLRGCCVRRGCRAGVRVPRVAGGRRRRSVPLLHVTNFAFKLKARRKRGITLIRPRMCGGLAFQNISGGGWGEELYFTGFSAISFRGRGCD